MVSQAAASGWLFSTTPRAVFLTINLVLPPILENSLDLRLAVAVSPEVTIRRFK